MPGLALLRVRPRRRRSDLVATLHDALTAAPEIAVNTTGTTTKSTRRTLTERPTPPDGRPTNQHHPPLSSPTAKCPLPSSSSAAASFSPPRQREDMKVAVTPSMIDEPMDYVDTATCRYLMPLPTVNDERNDKKQIPRLILKRRITRNLKRAAHATTTTIHKVAFQSKRKFTRSSDVKANTSKVRMVDTVIDTTKTTTTIASTAAAHNNIVTDDSSLSDTNHNDDRAVTTKLFPTRKRIPTNFYHATVSTTMTKHQNRVSRTNHHCHRSSSSSSNSNNDMNHNNASTTLPTTMRPQRKRIPTDFFSPFSLSEFFQIRTNPTRPVLPPQESVPIPIRSVTTVTSVPPPKRPKRTEPEETRVGTISTRDNGSPIAPVPEPTGVVVLSHINDDMPHGGNLSHQVLLADYQERAALGHCHPISFGKTLSSALLAIDRKIQSLKRQKQYQLDCQNSDDDKEIVADIREYKRSLRAFSVYEDREKLASIQELQESLEFWGRYYATTTVPSKRYQRCDPSLDHHGSSSNKSSRQNDRRMELSLLEKRPIVISSGVRMMSRSAFKCSNGANCIFGCHRKTMNDTKVWTANAVMAPVPLIQPFRIDDNEMDDHTSTVTKTKRTIDALRELESSLQFMATYQDTAEKFASLE